MRQRPGGERKENHKMMTSRINCLMKEENAPNKEQVTWAHLMRKDGMMSRRHRHGAACHQSSPHPPQTHVLRLMVSKTMATKNIIVISNQIIKSPTVSKTETSKYWGIEKLTSLYCLYIEEYNAWGLHYVIALLNIVLVAQHEKSVELEGGGRLVRELHTLPCVVYKLCLLREAAQPIIVPLYKRNRTAYAWQQCHVCVMYRYNLFRI